MDYEHVYLKDKISEECINRVILPLHMYACHLYLILPCLWCILYFREPEVSTADRSAQIWPKTARNLQSKVCVINSNRLSERM